MFKKLAAAALLSIAATSANAAAWVITAWPTNYDNVKSETSEVFTYEGVTCSVAADFTSNQSGITIYFEGYSDAGYKVYYGQGYYDGIQLSVLMTCAEDWQIN